MSFTSALVGGSDIGMAAKQRKPGVSRSPEIEVEILERMSKGEPLAVICRSDPLRFPTTAAWSEWCREDTNLGIAHAHARDSGYDAIAQDCLNIADANGQDVRYSEKGDEIVNSDVIQRAKLRVETRLKLLAKWDPKRYGDKLDVTQTTRIEPVSADQMADEMRQSPALRREIEAMLAKSTEL